MIGWYLLGVFTGIIATVVGIVLGLRLYTWQAERRSAPDYELDAGPDPDATAVIPRIQDRE